MTEPLGPTPSQTVGPYLSIVLPWADGQDIAAAGTRDRISITGRLTDGAGEPVPDGLIEVWQADPDGGFAHPDDPRGSSTYQGFRGFGRCPTNADGRYLFHTLKPGSLPDGAGGTEAPHLDLSVFARGLLHRLVTRIYFPDETEANDADPVLCSLEPADRARLIAMPDGAGYRFDVRLQGDDQTPFFRI
jgi:protocatechuate 3,4-dioxygenase alpha subunit